ncbi:MAG: PQQ-binding-like beta-propeller repeat protein [Segniliparus sp.]|uniref:outer membrane protein assembly factor BamB family protein n=1 Tax=Segniliparus sp. TaxID=2804064 RepID=UPI003F3A2B10
MGVSGGRRRAPWLRAWVVAAAVLVCAAALAAGLSFVAVKVRSQSGQSGQTAAKAAPPARPRPGGPFLDPIPALPRPLWTTPLAGLFPNGPAPSFTAANQDTALLSSLVSPRDRLYDIVALEAATGAKKWEVKANIPLDVVNCALSGDSQVLCWRDNPLDTATRDGIPPRTTRLVFIASSGGGTRQVTLSEPGAAQVVPLRDGFFVFKAPQASEGAPNTEIVFSSSGDRRWTTQGAAGGDEAVVAEDLGLVSVRGGLGAPQVRQLSDGLAVGDFSDLTSSATPGQQPLKVALNASGFTAENGKVIDVFNARGKKVNQIAGWRSLFQMRNASSAVCGKILLQNESGAVAAADSESGQILWQLPGRDGSSMLQASCVGDHFLLRAGFEQALGVYDLANGKQVGTISTEGDPAVVGTDGSLVLLRRSADQFVYDAYDLANGAFVWSSPPGQDGEYLFCAPGGSSTHTSSLMGGAIYTVSGKSVSRLGQKP